jgi:hypothetical protein
VCVYVWEWNALQPSYSKLHNGRRNKRKRERENWWTSIHFICSFGRYHLEIFVQTSIYDIKTFIYCYHHTLYYERFGRKKEEIHVLWSISNKVCSSISSDILSLFQLIKKRRYVDQNIVLKIGFFSLQITKKRKGRTKQKGIECFLRRNK